MKNSLAASTALAAVLAMSPTAQAEGLYGSFFGGVNLLGEVESEEFSVGGTPGYSYDIDFDAGFVIGGAIGLELGNGMRVEGEVSMRGNDVNQVTDTSPGSGTIVYDAEGDGEVLALMANAWYDFDAGGGFQPFVGGGIGLANIDIEGEEDSVFALQGGAGVSFPLASGVAITGEYRYFQLTNPSFFGVEFEVPGQHSFMVGARVPF